MAICKNCKYRDYYRTSVDGQCVIYTCGLFNSTEKAVNTVAGITYYISKDVECNKINKDGNCSHFEKCTLWQKILRLFDFMFEI